MKLIIDRAKWLRGVGDQSMLLRPDDGKMCCLGFLGLECGIPAAALEKNASPEDTPDHFQQWPSWLLQFIDERGFWRDTEECCDLIRTNDTRSLSEPEREEKIATIFAGHGVDVEFAGTGMPDAPHVQP